MAVRLSSARFVEIIYAQNPAALKEPMIINGLMCSVVGALSPRIDEVKSADEFEECMRILAVLLVDAKIDLLEIDKYYKNKSSHFAM